MRGREFSSKRESERERERERERESAIDTGNWRRLSIDRRCRRASRDAAAAAALDAAAAAATMRSAMAERGAQWLVSRPRDASVAASSP